MPGKTRRLLAGSGGWTGRLPMVLALSTAVVLLAGGGFAALESDTVETHWEGVWWALSLATTVGFVRETPHSTVGRLLSAVLMVSGFALMTFTTAAIASLFVREQEAPMEAMEQAFERDVAERLDGFADRLERIEAALETLAGEASGGALR